LIDIEHWSHSIPSSYVDIGVYDPRLSLNVLCSILFIVLFILV
jgi:hypothetical protein